MQRPYHIGLALSGGGARGFAHIGVYKAMQEVGIHPDIISGTSAGAITGVMFASGHTAEESYAFFREKKLLDFARPSMSRTGFMNLSGLGKRLAEFIEVKKTETVAVTNARNVGRVQRAIVNIDTLSQNFEKGDLITLEILKEKKLVPSRAGTLKILARGMLDKPLAVEADDYSIDAVKMILLTGGKPIKIDKK